MNFKKFLRITLDLLQGKSQISDWVWLEDVARFFTAYIFPVLAFLILFLVHLYFSEHLKLCQTSFAESFNVLQNDCVTVVYFLRSIPRLQRTCYFLVCAIIYCFMFTTYSEAMASESMQEAFYMIDVEKRELLGEVKKTIEKVKEFFNSSRK